MNPLSRLLIGHARHATGGTVTPRQITQDTVLGVVEPPADHHDPLNTATGYRPADRLAKQTDHLGAAWLSTETAYLDDLADAGGDLAAHQAVTAERDARTALAAARRRLRSTKETR